MGDNDRKVELFEKIIDRMCYDCRAFSAMATLGFITFPSILIEPGFGIILGLTTGLFFYQHHKDWRGISKLSKMTSRDDRCRFVDEVSENVFAPCLESLENMDERILGHAFQNMIRRI